ncbi:unnamed protein product [Boreogadus saida]
MAMWFGVAGGFNATFRWLMTWEIQKASRTMSSQETRRTRHCIGEAEPKEFPEAANQRQRNHRINLSDAVQIHSNTANAASGERRNRTAEYSFNEGRRWSAG